MANQRTSDHSKAGAQFGRGRTDAGHGDNLERVGLQDPNQSPSKVIHLRITPIQFAALEKAKASSPSTANESMGHFGGRILMQGLNAQGHAPSILASDTPTLMATFAKFMEPIHGSLSNLSKEVSSTHVSVNSSIFEKDSLAEALFSHSQLLSEIATRQSELVKENSRMLALFGRLLARLDAERHLTAPSSGTQSGRKLN